MLTPTLASIDETQAALDLLMLEELDTTPTCEARPTGVTCGAPAAWLVLFSCGHVFALCEEHHEIIRQRFAAGTLNSCADMSPPRHAPMRVTVEWHKIRGGAS
ncbi:MAG TPA: hypothetical protein VGL98_03600 [Gammaproteobacteria bacterium]